MEIRRKYELMKAGALQEDTWNSLQQQCSYFWVHVHVNLLYTVATSYKYVICNLTLLPSRMFLRERKVDDIDNLLFNRLDIDLTQSQRGLASTVAKAATPHISLPHYPILVHFLLVHENS